jgi:hypothetical protein
MPPSTREMMKYGDSFEAYRSFIEAFRRSLS